jgi:hypothetical protein
MMRKFSASLGVFALTVAALIGGGSPAQAALVTVQGNMSQGAIALSSHPSCTPGSGPENAVDGAASDIHTDKWCVPSGKPTLTIVLPSDPLIVNRVVNKIVVKHAGVAEATAWNTRAYRIYTSPTVLYPTWTLVATETHNTSSVDTFSFPGRRTSMVRLDVDIPTLFGDPATRIYEVEVWGTWTVDLSVGLLSL